SPFAVNVMDTQRVVVFGKGLGSVPVNVPTSFTILTQNAGAGELKCSIKDPDDHGVSCVIAKTDTSRYEVSYTPDTVGDYKIEVLHNNVPVDDKPYIARVFDINKVMIYDFPSSAIVDTATYFIIDATDSGSGNLEIAVSINDKNIPNYVQNEGGARFRVKFTPDQSGMYHIHIKFNGIDIHGSPFTCNVFSSDFIFENYEYAPINKRTAFVLKPKANSVLNPNLYINVISPSGHECEGKIEEKSPNLYTVRFIPNEIGDHQIIFYSDKDKKFLITKFISQVFDASKIRISDLPPAVPHRPYKFTINTEAVGDGHLSIKLKQNSNRLSHEQTRLNAHNYEVSFVPETSDECTLSILFNGDDGLGNFKIPVMPDSKEIRVAHIPTGTVGKPIIFTIDINEPKPLDVLVTESHGGRVIPHTMIPLNIEKKRYQITFIPLVARQHTVSVSYNDQPMSSYHVDVFDINKIRVSSIEDGIVGTPLVFTVDTHGAGEGHLEVTISDGKRTLPAELKSIHARKFDIGFLPETSGKYMITIAFNGIPVEGSPFVIHIHAASSTNDKASTQGQLDEEEDDDEEEQEEEEEAEEEEEEEEEETGEHEFLIGGQLEGTKVGELAWLICDTPLSEIYEDFDLFVSDPDQVTIKHTRIQDSGGRWRVEFEPIKSGIHQIQTNVNGNDESSLILASMDILPANYHRTIEGERIIHPNVLNYITINSTNDNLKVRIRRSNGDEIPVGLERDALEWKVYCTLAETDYYQMSVNDNGDEQIFDIHCVSEETDIFRNGGIEDITRLIVDESKLNGSDVNVIVKDPFAHTIPAAFYRNFNRDLIIEYVPTKLDVHEVFIRTHNNLLDICPIRIMSFGAISPFEPVLRVQVKEVLQHTFEGVIDNVDKIQIDIIDSFERPLPFQRSTNEIGELTVALSPVRVGTHWIRVSNNDSKNFALLPIFAYDDDYVPLSPIVTPSPDDKKGKQKSSKNMNHNHNNNNNNTGFDTFIPLLAGKDLTTISETTETSSSRTSSATSSELPPPPSPVKEIVAENPPAPIATVPKVPTTDGRASPEVQVLDITDLNDPGIGTVSKFSFKDPDNKFNIAIIDTDGNTISYRTEYLLDGRKQIFYEVTTVGPVEIHISKENEPINGSPLVVHAFNPASVYLMDFPDKLQLNTTNRFIINPTKAGKGSLKIAVKDPNNRSVPITVLKRSNGHVTVEFKPVTLGLYTTSVLFNRVPIPETPLRVAVEAKEPAKIPEENVPPPPPILSGSLGSIDDIELHGRAPHPKPVERERPRSVSSQTTFDPINTRLSKSNENITQTVSQQTPTFIEQHRTQRVTKSEDRHSSASVTTPLNDLQIQRFNILKDKFERQQPIDTVFGARY
ncbi:unnamed protein product, partial [Adineta ricciae]